MDGQVEQKKTCRKKQHVKIYKERYAPKIICRLAAVGKNYNSTRNTEDHALRRNHKHDTGKNRI